MVNINTRTVQNTRDIFPTTPRTSDPTRFWWCDLVFSFAPRTFQPHQQLPSYLGHLNQSEISRTVALFVCGVGPTWVVNSISYNCTHHIRHLPPPTSEQVAKSRYQHGPKRVTTPVGKLEFDEHASPRSYELQPTALHNKLDVVTAGRLQVCARLL